jgi:hypothetical protein
MLRLPQRHKGSKVIQLTLLLLQGAFTPAAGKEIDFLLLVL